MEKFICRHIERLKKLVEESRSEEEKALYQKELAHWDDLSFYYGLEQQFEHGIAVLNG